jgi:hypothetical protein
MISTARKGLNLYRSRFLGRSFIAFSDCVVPAIALPLFAAASRHAQSAIFYPAVQKCSDHILHGTANMGDDPNSCCSDGRLLSLGNHSANEYIHAQSWQQFGSLEGILHNQEFFATPLFLSIGDVHQQNPASLIENR